MTAFVQAAFVSAPGPIDLTRYPAGQYHLTCPHRGWKHSPWQARELDSFSAHQ